MSFLPGSLTPALLRSCRRKVISHSDGHSVVGCRKKQKEPITQSTKNRRERGSRFKMMFYVTALKFKDGTVFAPIHSLTVPKRIEWWVSVFSLSIPLALGGFATSQSYIVFSCAPHLRGLYYTIKPAANQEIYDGF